jgi:NAD(P)-dependent dehydrogenase (short-subunit alcohol dehydrogenase family)
MADSFSAKLDFTGRVALITGGASWIGYAVATQLGELGARVAIADLNIDGAEAAVTRLCAFGVEVSIAK